MTAFLACLLLMVASPLLAAGSSISIDGSKVDATLTPDKSEVVLGEPTMLSFTVRNESDKDLLIIVGGDYENSLGRPNSFKVSVRDESGSTLPELDAGPSFGGIFGPNKIPAHGEYVFRLLTPHWVSFKKPGTYSITAARDLDFTDAKQPVRIDKSKSFPVEATANVTVLPPNEVELGEVIASLGSKVGSRQDIWTSPARLLAYIDDPRVIPYLAKAVNYGDYDAKLWAYGSLEKFNDDAAFAALKKGFETTGKDITNATTLELAGQLSENARVAAAASLAQSAHPAAKSFLIANRHDPVSSIRLTALHTVAAMPLAEALPIIKEMESDPVEIVSNEAKRYEKLLTNTK